MNFDEYQDKCEETLLPQCNNFEYVTLGLVGEAGEIANKVKKVIRRDYREEKLKQMLLGELGDALYYLAMSAKLAGFPLSEVAQFNVQKLARRKQEGKIQGDGDQR